MSTCQNCRFYLDTDVPIEPGEFGQCRRYPPAMNQEVMRVESLAFAAEHPSEHEGIAAHEAGVRTILGWQFPVVAGDEWCGEFQPANTEPPAVTRRRVRTAKRSFGEVRDQWAYEQVCDTGTTYDDIIDALKAECADKGWPDTLNTPQALVKAAKRHIKRTGSPAVPARRSIQGTPSTETTQ